MRRSRANPDDGFTLVELLVVIGVIAVLIVVQLPALAGAKSQSKIAICASHVRQIALACQIYANENNNRLPVPAGGGNWAWDVSGTTISALLNSGAQTNTFYCPGTAPRFTDTQNWAGPGATLWIFSGGSFRVIGYALALSGASGMNPTNENSSILPEAIGNFPLAGMTTTYGVSDRVLVADATISLGSAVPGYAHPENNYTDIAGGFPIHHVSPHLKGNVPAGGNLGFKDGHVEWRDFEFMTPRTTGGTYFWW